MGTHPIFESDFDCLTEMNSALMAQIQGGKGLKKVPAHEKNDRSEVKTGNAGVKNGPISGGRGPPPPNTRPTPNYGGGGSLFDELRKRQNGGTAHRGPPLPPHNNYSTICNRPPPNLPSSKPPNSFA